MSLNEEERKILVGLEIEKSRRTFAEIEILRQAGLWDNIANRLYYAAFHAVSALLINDKHPVGTHQGAVVMLHQHYVKTGILPKEDGAFIPNFKLCGKRAITTVLIMPRKKILRHELL
jgi:hypothetical protein